MTGDGQVLKERVGLKSSRGYLQRKATVATIKMLKFVFFVACLVRMSKSSISEQSKIQSPQAEYVLGDHQGPISMPPSAIMGKRQQSQENYIKKKLGGSHNRNT